VHIRDTIKVIIIFSFAFLFVVLEESIKSVYPLSGLIGVMALGATLLKKYELLAKRLVGKFEKIWVLAEIMLFVLVGATLDIGVIPTIGVKVIILIVVALIIRMGGVYVSLIASSLNRKEKLFVAISYLPKATVQAAIGSIPLAMGLEVGPLILTAAVLSILLTAPLGAILIDATSDHFLE
jgi:NhaP-type Na+/H+ or K+/H+ antiporter